MKRIHKTSSFIIAFCLTSLSCPSTIGFNDISPLPDLNSEDDLGFSDSDNITSRTESLRFTVAANDGTQVELWDDSSLLHTSESQNGRASFSIALSSGTHYIKARSLLEDGGYSSFSEPAIVLVDDEKPEGVPVIESPFPRKELGSNRRPKFEWSLPRNHELIHIQVDNDSRYIEPEIDESYLSSYYYIPRADLPFDSSNTRGTIYYFRIRFVDIAGNYGDWTDSSKGVFLVGHCTNDINSDGYSDFLIGSSGGMDVFFGGSVFDSYPEMSSHGSGSHGSALTALGDINSDGFADFGVGDPSSSPNYRGRAYIYLGAELIEPRVPYVAIGEADNGYLGVSISPAYDFNGDGYDDVIIGAFGVNINQGQATVYLGGESFNTVGDITFSGGNQGDYFGAAVAGIGDSNGDGYDDLLIGSPGFDGNRGRVYLYYGSATMDAVPDLILEGENASDFFGQSISMAGDLNNDGYSDYIVGAYGFYNNTGRAYVYAGGASQSVAPMLTCDGKQANDFFGWALSGGIDENGDGYPDFAIGAYGHSSETGRVYVYWGGVVLSSSPSLILSGQSMYSQFGFSVGSAGDTNGDGYGDFIIGAPRYNNYLGRAFLYNGGPSMNNVPDIVFTGLTANKKFGYSVGH